jgi:hypothetical protein
VLPQLTTAQYKTLKSFVLAEIHGLNDDTIVQSVSSIPSLSYRWAQMRAQLSNHGSMELEEVKKYIEDSGFKVETIVPGVPSMEMMTWPVLAKVGPLIIRQCPLRVWRCNGEEKYSKLLDDGLLLESPDKIIGRRWQNIVVEYNNIPSTDVLHVYKQVAQQTQGTAVDISVGLLPDDSCSDLGNFFVLMRKQDLKNMCTPVVDGISACAVYRVVPPNPWPETTANTLVRVATVCNIYAGTLFLDLPSEKMDCSYESLVEGSKKMTLDQFKTLKGRIVVKESDHRSDFEKAFLRAASILECYVIKEIPSKVGCLCLDALDLPAWVRPLEDLRSLSATHGRRLVQALPAVGHEWEKFTLQDIFNNVGIMRQYSIGIHGGDGTTSFGKTMCSIRLAAHYVQCCLEAGVVAPTQRFILLSNGTEDAKLVDFSSMGVAAWVLDEWTPGDSNQAQHMSSDMLKVLLSPASPCSLRCKGTELLTVPANIPRIFTSNHETGDSWCGTRFQWAYPHMRKKIWFTVKSPLLSNESRKKNIMATDPVLESLGKLAKNKMAAQIGLDRDLNA